MIVARYLMALSALLMFVPAAQAQSQGPSFSCSTADLEAEVTVCESRRLSRLDRQVDRLYRDLSQSVDTGRERRKLRRDQRDWLAQRNSCEDNRRCLRRRYEERVQVLQQLASGGGQDEDDFAGSERPSFSCRNVRQDAERVICRSSRLATLDREMDTLYQDVTGAIFNFRARRRLVRNQQNWLRGRNECGRDRRCLRRAYEDRVAALRDVKRKLKPAYQRTARWRALCRNMSTPALRATCTNPELWQLNTRWYQAFYQAQKAFGNNAGLRAYFARIQAKWGACGAGIRCQDRVYRKSIDELSDRRFLRRLRREGSQEAYRDDRRWRATCRANATVALRATCNSRQLWELNTEWYRVFEDAKSRIGATAGLRDYSVRFQSSWASCGSNRQCQDRAYRNSIAELGDKRFLRRLRDGGGDRAYRRERRWRSTCGQSATGALRATCDSSALWALNTEWFSRFEDAKKVTPNLGALNNYYVKFQRDWATCGPNRQCQDRVYRRSIAELGDRSYLRRLGVRVNRLKKRRNDPYGANSDTR